MNSKNNFFPITHSFPSISKVSLLITLFFALTSTTAQNCSQPNITLRNQVAINNFQANFGPCTTIVGTLFIEDNNNGTNNITNLDGLSGVTEIGGTLRILNNPNLQNIDGLENLSSVGQNLQIDNNPNLSNIEGLTNLNSVGNNLRLIDNLLITNIDALSNLNNVGGDVGVQGNNNLRNIDGLAGLSSINGDLRIRNNNNLTNVNGLQNINSVGGDFAVRNNNILAECCGLFPVLMNEGVNVGGTIDMLGNLAAGNCNNNGADVTAACLLVASIPTLSEWGLIVLALLLMIFGTLYLMEGRSSRKNTV